jgi:hypothetical protein
MRERHSRSGRLMDAKDPLIRSLSQPYPLADMATFNGKLAKASLLGEN